MQLKMAEVALELGSPVLGSLRESNDALSDTKALQKRMAEDGYLLLRGVQRRENVEQTRRFLLENLAENGQIDLDYPLVEGVIKKGARGAFMGGSKTLTRNPKFLATVESEEIMNLFELFLEAPVLTFDYKWLRLIGQGDFSGAHYDMPYMGRGTRNVYTCWTPLGDTTYDMGPLVILEDSHKSPAMERVRQTYGKMDVDRDHVTGAFSNDPLEMIERYGGRWLTSEFEMGDVLIFDMFTMHGSLTNTSNRFRISTDTRYQRAGEPADERWMGADPIAHYAWMEGKTVTMEEARKTWEV
ncbi:hypothetical protein LBMAG21_06970 [Armatimonadota bacterium]|nr:hypothetical protein LBMAG21_06970 [Armatimonadota bacterium]